MSIEAQHILSARRLRCPLCGSTVTREQAYGFVRAACSSPTCNFVQDVDQPRQSSAQANTPAVIVMPGLKIPAPQLTTKCRIPSCVGSITHVGDGQAMRLCGRHLASWNYLDQPQGEELEKFVDLYEEFEQDVNP